MAVNRQRPQNDLIFHSDRGVQYASTGYREVLAEYNITQSTFLATLSNILIILL